MRGGHLAWVAAAALLGTTPARAEHLDAGERQRGAIVVLALGKGTTIARVSAVEQAAAEVFTASTAISLKPGALYGIDAPAVAACDPQILLSCVVEQTRGEGSAPPQFILLVSLRAQSGARQRASGYFLALEPARAIFSKPRSPGDDGAERERELYRTAQELDRVELASLEPAALHDYFNQLLRRLRARSDDPALSPLGPIERSGALNGLTLELDPQPLAPPPPPALSRDVLRWSGVGGAVLGIALMAVGGAKYSSVRTVCLSRRGQPGSCGSIGTPSLGFDASQALTGDPRRINPAGVGFIPLGLGLFTAGASWTLGCQLFGEDHELPWPQLLVGLGLGALSYAVSAAAL